MDDATRAMADSGTPGKRAEAPAPSLPPAAATQATQPGSLASASDGQRPRVRGN